MSPWLTVTAVLLTLLAVALVGRDVYNHSEGRAAGPAAAANPARTAAPVAVAATAKPAVAATGKPAGERPPVDPLGPRSAIEPAAPPGEPIVRVRPGKEVELRNAPRGKVVAEVDDETSFGSTTVFSVNRRRPGWIGVPTEELPNGELGWVRDDPGELRGDYTDHRIVVDLSEHSTKLYEGDEVVMSWTVTIGAPDTPTPTGEFSVTDLFEGGLHPTYGCCAIALSATQPNLPPEWPGGDRIAFHGTAGALGVDASNGCIRMADGDVRDLLEAVPLGTPVRIRE